MCPARSVAGSRISSPSRPTAARCSTGCRRSCGPSSNAARRLKPSPADADCADVRDRLRTDAPWWAAALAGVLTMSWLALQGFAWSDYDNEVSAAFRALSAGDIDGFLGRLPA